jgi:hypothetical protein
MPEFVMALPLIGLLGAIAAEGPWGKNGKGCSWYDVCLHSSLFLIILAGVVFILAMAYRSHVVCDDRFLCPPGTDGRVFGGHWTRPTCDDKGNKWVTRNGRWVCWSEH